MPRTVWRDDPIEVSFRTEVPWRDDRHYVRRADAMDLLDEERTADGEEAYEYSDDDVYGAAVRLAHRQSEPRCCLNA